METPRYEYDGKIWVPSETVADGNCFFHSVFGKEVGDRFYDEDAEFRRLWWIAFLKYFEKKPKPSRLAEQLEKCCVVRNRYLQRSIEKHQEYDMYVKSVYDPNSVVHFLEIPILSALENVKIILFYKGFPEPLIIEPDTTMLENYTQRNKNLLEAYVLFDPDLHFSQMKPTLTNKNSENVKNATNSENVNGKIKREIYCRKDGKFKKLGSAGIEGGLYQIHLLTIFLLNGLKRHENFKLSTENGNAGKFDDVVLEFESNKAAILLQAKHKKGRKKKVAYSDLFSTNSKNDDFSLPKYFVSYLEVKKAFNVQNVILCTNTGIKLDQTLATFLIKNKLSEDSVLYFKDADQTVYKLKNVITSEFKETVFKYCDENPQFMKNINKNLVCDENIEEFFNHLQIVADYPAKTNLEQIIENTISQMIISKNLDSKAAFKYIHKKMFDWFKEENGRYLTQLDARNLFCKIRSNNYCEMLHNNNINFKQDKLEFYSNKKILHFIYSKEYILILLRIFNISQRNKHNSLFVNPNEDLIVQEQIIEAFENPKYDSLIIVSVENNKILAKEVCEKLIDNLKRSTYKKLILIANKTDKLVSRLNINENTCETIQDIIQFSDLTKETQDNILKTKYVNFQNQDMPLKDVVSPKSEESLNQILGSDILIRLINNYPIQIGSHIQQFDKTVKNHYISRRFIHQNRQDVQEKDFCRSTEIDRKNVVLICNKAGMGKSTILTSLSHKLKKYCPDLWVMRIDLNSYTKILNEYLTNNLNVISIEDLLNSQDSTKFKSCFEENVFLMPGKVILMLDGMDEISPTYTDLIVNLIKDSLKRPNIRKIFVTSRPHMQNNLETIFNVKTTVLQPLDRFDQINFLTEYWIKELKVDNGDKKLKCRQFARALLDKLSFWSFGPSSEYPRPNGEVVVTIPLQIRLLAEVFQTGTMEFQGCKEFIESSRDEPMFLTNLGLAKIYESFVNRKRNIYINEKGNANGNQIMINVLQKELNILEHYHHFLALKLMFNEEQCSFFTEITKRPDEIPETSLIELGIMQKVDGKLNFIHRTFAEYFVAKCLIRELIYGKENASFHNFFLNELLPKEEYITIRSFLDSLLANEDLQSLEINTSVKNCHIDSLDSPVIFYRIAAEGSVEILNLVLKYYNIDISEDIEYVIEEAAYYKYLNVIKYLLEEGHIDIKSIDHFTVLDIACNELDFLKKCVELGLDVTVKNNKKKTLLFQAASIGNLEVIDFLLEKGIDINARDKTGQTALCPAISSRRADAVKYLIDKGANFNTSNLEGVGIFHEAAMFGLTDLGEYLVSHGIEVNSVDNLSNTALHHAVENNNLKFVEFLLSKSKINVNIKNIHGKTAFDLGRERGAIKVIACLKKYKADV